MSQAFTPGLIQTAHHLVTKLRELPVPGELLVKLGDQVRADQVVARAFLPGDLEILRVSEKLGIEPELVANSLKAKVGDEIQQGQILFQHSALFGLLKSTFISPVTGKLEFINQQTGHLGVRKEARAIELKAYIDGTVKKLTPNKSVLLENKAAFIQGIFGVGGERYGKLTLVTSKTAQILPSDLPADCKNQILFASNAPTGQTLKLASERGAVGFVVGSVDDAALNEFLGYDIGIALTGDEKISMTLIITEGFGQLAMSARAFQLLSACQGHFAAINGATQVRAGALRPEIIVGENEKLTLEKFSENTNCDQALKVGSKIRLIRYPYFGQDAEVIELPHQPQMIASGASTRVLLAKLVTGSREQVVVPRANVELVQS